MKKKKKKDLVSAVLYNEKETDIPMPPSLYPLCLCDVAEKSFCFLLPLDSIVFSGDRLLLKKKKRRFVKSINAKFFLSKFVRVSLKVMENCFRKSYESICRESV